MAHVLIRSGPDRLTGPLSGGPGDGGWRIRAYELSPTTVATWSGTLIEAGIPAEVPGLGPLVA
ncbi:MAG TPA: hypothetical protein VLH10_14345 [Yinghuangia sp.]|nr:hypothetical protein [Yinghuangia sp.]